MRTEVKPGQAPYLADGSWVCESRVTVYLTEDEYRQMDGIRIQARPWLPYRVRVRRDPAAAPESRWSYEVVSSAGITAAVGDGPTQERAMQDGLSERSLLAWEKAGEAAERSWNERP